MELITTIGIDLAKTVCQIHVIDGSGKVLLQKAVKRAALLAKLPACLIQYRRRPARPSAAPITHPIGP